MILTDKEIEAAKSENGAWTRETLQKWGVSWPPKKGWKDKLQGLNPQVEKAKRRSEWKLNGKVKKIPVKHKKIKKIKKPKVRNKFYSSWEWKKLRYEVLRERGAKCELCGITAAEHPLGYVVVDHIKNVREFPHLSLDKRNCQVLCNDCNMGKSYHYDDDWRPETARSAKADDIREWLDE